MIFKATIIIWASVMIGLEIALFYVCWKKFRDK